MLRRALTAAWYGDCRLDGQLAYLTNLPNVGWRVQVNDLPLKMPPIGLPGFLRITDDGPLKLCGQGADGFPNAGAAIEYVLETDEWLVPAPATYGVSPLIYRGQDIVYSTVADGSQGFRYVSNDGRVITGDNTVNHGTAWAQQCGIIGPLWEWSYFEGLAIGQGETGCIAEWQGKRYVLSTGQVYFIRVRRKDSAVSVYIVKPGYTEALWFDVSELGSAELPLEPVPVPPDPPSTIPAPKITNVKFNPLLKAGQPWQVTFDCVETQFRVEISAAQQLKLHAVNATDEDHTGLVRQLTIEGPDVEPEPEPEPEPPPMHTESRFWLHPNIGSKDLLDIFDDPSRLANVDVFGLYVQEILTDVSNPQLGTNIYPNLVQHDVFRKLAAAGIPLAIELGSVKPGDCHAESNIAGMQAALQRVHDAGGVVGYLTMDEPLTANQQACGGGLVACAGAVAAFIHSAAAIDPDIKVGWIEAWPEVSYANQASFLALLEARDAVPAHWHLDIDWNRAAKEHKDPAAFIHQCQSLADSYGIVLGVQVNSTVDPIANDTAHALNLENLAHKLQGILPDAQRVVTQSWCTRTGGTQDVPNNLGEFGLLDTLAVVRPLFEPVTPEPPLPEDSIMLSSYADPAKGVIAVKAVKPIAGSKLATLISPNDKVVSCQPDGTLQERDAGTEGAYEKCHVGANVATFQPIPGAYHSHPFVEVGGFE